MRENAAACLQERENFNPGRRSAECGALWKRWRPRGNAPRSTRWRRGLRWPVARSIAMRRCADAWKRPGRNSLQTKRLPRHHGGSAWLHGTTPHPRRSRAAHAQPMRVRAMRAARMVRAAPASRSAHMARMARPASAGKAARCSGRRRAILSSSTGCASCMRRRKGTIPSPCPRPGSLMPRRGRSACWRIRSSSSCPSGASGPPGLSRSCLNRRGAGRKRTRRRARA